MAPEKTPSCTVEVPYCGWTKSTSHHLRNPRTMIPFAHTTNVVVSTMASERWSERRISISTIHSIKMASTKSKEIAWGQLSHDMHSKQKHSTLSRVGWPTIQATKKPAIADSKLKTRWNHPQSCRKASSRPHQIYLIEQPGPSVDTLLYLIPPLIQGELLLRCFNGTPKIELLILWDPFPCLITNTHTHTLNPNLRFELLFS